MPLSRVVSKIFNVEKYRDLEIGVRGHSRSLKVVLFERLCDFLLVFFSNFVPKMHRFEIFDLYTVTLKPGLEVTQGHRK